MLKRRLHHIGVEAGVDEPRSASGDTASTSTRGLSARMNLWATALTALTATLALVLSLVSWLQINTRADVIMTLTKVISVRATPGTMDIILGFTFAAGDKSDLTSIVTDVTLKLTPPPGVNDSREFYWARFMKIVAAEDLTSQRVYVAADEPGPIVVSQAPQVQYLLFTALHGGNPAAGRWTGVAAAEIDGQDGLIEPICIVVPVNLSKDLSDKIYVQLRSNPPNGNDGSNKECYRK